MHELTRDNEIKKHRIIFIVFTVFACLAPLLAISIPYFPHTENAATWFQRSGSAVVALSIIAESSAISIYNELNPSGFVSIDFEKLEIKYNKLPKKYTKISLSLIALGTIIWGYGDLLFTST